MPIRFRCPYCDSRLSISRRHAGRRGKCPFCQKKIDVPDVDVHLPAEDAAERAEAFAGDSSGAAAASVTGAATKTGEERQIWHEISPTDLAVPRWVVYAQGALLGVVATTFFIFGLMVGNVTAPRSGPQQSEATCRVSGSVFFQQDNQRFADTGAVVIILPTDARPQQRPDPGLLRPDQFQPLDNPSIDDIRQLGGSVVRVDQEGNFETSVRSRHTYYVLVVSKGSRRSPSMEISKQLRADLGAFFFPVEDLLGDRQFQYNKIKLTGHEYRNRAVVFGS